MEIRDHDEEGEGEENRIWDCGSRLYDSYELASVVRHIERHIGPSSSPPPSSIGTAKNVQVEEDRRRSWFARNSTIWRRNVKSPNSATSTVQGKEKEESRNNFGYGIFKSLGLWKTKSRSKIDEPCI